jgi:membrane fusion protein, multidrug efflux system
VSLLRASTARWWWKCRSRSPRRASLLAFRIAGKLLRRAVDAGDRVDAGAVLAEIDPEDARLAANAAEAAVRAAEADHRLAEAELRRARELLERGFLSASGFELQENTFKLAEARLRQARAEAAVTRNQTQYTRLLADRAGVITEVLAEPGQVLAAGQGVLRLVPDEGREVEIQVPEGRLEALQAANGLVVKFWALPELSLNATLREITPQADRFTRTHRVRVALGEADPRVRLGMTANVVQTLETDRPLFGVALTALGEHQGQPSVWTVTNESLVQPVPVEVVRYTENAAIVAGALSADDALVTAGVHLLSAGERVRALPRQRRGADAP